MTRSQRGPTLVFSTLKWPLRHLMASWAWCFSGLFQLQLHLFSLALSSWLHIKTEIHDMIYLQIFLSQAFSFCSLYSSPLPQNKWILYSIPLLPRHLVHIKSYFTSSCPSAYGYCRFIIFFTFYFKVIFFFLQGLFSKFAYVCLLIGYAKTLSSAVWLFPNHHWFSTSPLISSLQVLRKK